MLAIAPRNPLLRQSRQVVRLHQKANGSGFLRRPFDEPITMQGLDHFVNRRRGDSKVALQVRL